MCLTVTADTLWTAIKPFHLFLLLYIISRTVSISGAKAKLLLKKLTHTAALKSPMKDIHLSLTTVMLLSSALRLWNRKKKDSSHSSDTSFLRVRMILTNTATAINGSMMKTTIGMSANARTRRTLNPMTEQRQIAKIPQSVRTAEKSLQL